MSLVLFDIDGTLIRNAGGHHKQALIEGIRRATGALTTLDGIATHGMLDCDLIRGMLGSEEDHPALEQIMAECEAAYLDNCAPSLRERVCPGVLDTLRALRGRDAVLGLVTGNLRVIGKKKMELAGLADYFTVGAFSGQGRTRGELAAVAALEARALGLAAHDARVTLIGDHPNDVEAGRRNGFQTVAVATGLSSWDELEAARPDLLVRTLADLDLELLF
ncbi:MAG TPA: haloacid dehalogenase-like hydrolase [Bryobacteraceae bacterium]|jgi:phosphoglycolate phosphatase-like HAD superfamily hydrolase|nr:haloacid dehalogenase-like hydrolase [Bryobacteraceae bacterium]